MLTVTPVVMEGDYHLVGVNYPLSPEDPFPYALLSALRVLSHLHSNGLDRVSLCGESFGSIISSMAAAIIENPALLEGFEQVLVDYGIQDKPTEWSFPVVDSVVVWCGIMDGEAWRGKGLLSWGLAFTMKCYTRKNPMHRVDQDAPSKFTYLSEILPHLDSYPPLCMIVGAWDELGLKHSNEKMHRLMHKHGKQCSLHVVPGGHAFLLPPVVNRDWKNTAHFTINKVLEHLQKHHLRAPPHAEVAA